MKIGLRIEGRERQVEVELRGGSLHFRLDGRDLDADVMEVMPGTFSILIGGQAYEAHVETQRKPLVVHIGSREYGVEVIDPRQWRRDRASLAEAEGRQQIVAPMPGKIVRLLVRKGEAVEGGQGLLVVEAMKMQNEIKSPKSGEIERVIVQEGQAVSAGEPLIIIA
jgi:biotin carboxyl carrier protein